MVPSLLLRPSPERNARQKHISCHYPKLFSTRTRPQPNLATFAKARETLCINSDSRRHHFRQTLPNSSGAIEENKHLRDLRLKSGSTRCSNTVAAIIIILFVIVFVIPLVFCPCLQTDQTPDVEGQDPNTDSGADERGRERERRDNRRQNLRRMRITAAIMSP